MTPQEIQAKIDADAHYELVGADGEIVEVTAAVVPIGELIPRPRNPRKNTDAAKALAKAITKVGWGAPILVQRETGVVIGGHTRIKAAHQLGLERLPVRFVDVDDQRAKEMALADNRLAELADWDFTLLGEELSEFGLEDAETLGFDSRFLEKMAAKLDDFGPLDVDASAAPDQSGMLDGIGFGVVVYCDNEEHQRSVLERCESEGWKCRALT